MKISLFPPLAPVFLQKAWGSPSDSRPPGFHLRGFLISQIQVGEKFHILTSSLQGQESTGLFVSSPVNRIEASYLLRLGNSGWIILPLKTRGPGRGLLFAGLLGGFPIQCRLCGDIIRSTDDSTPPLCRCRACQAPAPGTSLEDLPPEANISIPDFMDPNLFPKGGAQ